MKKWTKVLSTFVVATVMSAGMAAVAGCDSCGGDKPDGGDQHTHTYAADWKSDKDGHWKESTCGHEDSEKQAHEDKLTNGTDIETADDLCDICGYDLSVPNPVDQVTVTFNSNGGSAVAAQTIDKGAKATKPTDPTKGTDVFGGWFTDDKTFENAFDFNAPVNASVTVFAKWTPKSANPVSHVPLTFTPLGGSPVASQSCYKGGKVVKPEDPTKEDGSIFDGWYEDEELFNDFNFDTAVNASMTLYAKWRTPTKFDTLANREDNLVAEDFSTTTTMTAFSGTYGNAGVYVAHQKGGEDVSSAYSVTAGGALDVGKGSKDTDNNAIAVVDFGTVTSSVEGYFKLNIKDSSATSTYNTITFCKSNGGEVLKIEAVGTEFKYSGVTAAPENVVTAAANTDYIFEFKFENNKVTLKINDKAIFTEVDCGSDPVVGFNIRTSNHGQRHFVVDDIAVCGTPMTVDAYRVIAQKEIDEAFEKMVGKEAEGDKPAVVGTHTRNAADITAAHGAVDLSELTTIADLQAKVAEFKALSTTIDSDAKIDAEIAKLTAAVATAKAGANGYQINKTAFDAVIADYEDVDLSSEKTVSAVSDKITDFNTALTAVKNDETVIGEYAATKEAEITAHKATEIEALTDATLKTAINNAKTAAIAALDDGITALEGYADSESANYYITVIDGKVDAAKLDIETRLSSAGMTLDQAKEDAESKFAAHITASLAPVKANDPAWGAKLDGGDEAADAPALDLDSCTAVGDVQTALDNAKGAYTTWLEGKIAAKTYTVSLNGTTLTGVTVGYGKQLGDINLNDYLGDNAIVDPTDSALYTSADHDTAYVKAPVYANVSVYVKTVTAIKLDNGFSWKYATDKANMPAGLVGSLTEDSSRNAMALPQNGSLTFEVKGTSANNSIKIVAGSTGSNNWSTIGVKDPDGNYIEINEAATGNIAKLSSGLYAVKTQNDVSTLTFKTPVAGTYTIVNVTVTADESSVGPVGRPTCLREIVFNNFYKEAPVEATGIDITKDGEVVDYDAGLTIASGSLQLGYDIPKVDGKTPNNVDLTTVTWVSSDEDVVTVAEDGTVTVVGSGTATITVIVECIDGSTIENDVDINVPASNATEITLDKTTLAVAVDEEFALNASLNGTVYDGITWTVTKDGADATAEMTDFEGDDTYGQGTFKQAGTYVITASIDGVDGAVATCTVTVSANADWSLDFAGNKVGTAGQLANNAKLDDKVTVTDVGYKTQISSGYLSANSKNGKDPVFTFDVAAAATFTIKYNGTQEARTFVIKDSEGNTVGSGNMSSTAQTFDLAAGTYTIVFAGGEHKITELSLTYKKA